MTSHQDALLSFYILLASQHVIQVYNRSVSKNVLLIPRTVVAFGEQEFNFAVPTVIIVLFV